MILKIFNKIAKEEKNEIQKRKEKLTQRRKKDGKIGQPQNI